MAKLALNKSQLKKERDKLKLYEKVLPSLDLKRMQLTAELKRARTRLLRDRERIEQLRVVVGEQLPMLAYHRIKLKGLVKVTDVVVGEENVMGVRLPRLEEVVYSVTEYSLLAKPHWVDVLVERLKEMARLELTAEVADERLQLLDRAVRRITQRVNLFEKVLIPSAKRNIQRIQIFLGDAERSAIVRSKLAKAIRQLERKAREATTEEGEME